MVYDGETPEFDKVYVVRKNQIVDAYCNEDFVSRTE
jgi:hypothetical protein